MAYVDQDRKKRIEKLVKPVFAKYGVKARLSVRHWSTLVCTISEGPINFVDDVIGDATHFTINHLDVNHFNYKNHFTGKTLEFLSELIPLLQSENYDNSDPMVDHFDIGYHLDVQFGKWDKPYKLTT